MEEAVRVVKGCILLKIVVPKEEEMRHHQRKRG